MDSVTSALSDQQVIARRSGRAARFISRRFLHFNSSLHRLRFCGIDPVQAKGSAFKGDKFAPGETPGGHVTVKASGSGKSRRAGYGSLQVCGSVWSCPVCSHKINAVRAADIAAAVAAWHNPLGPVPRQGPGRVVFLTLTMRHRKGQDLDVLWTSGISAAWGAATSGRAWVGDQSDYGVMIPRLVKTGKRAGEVVRSMRIGYARVVETTWGASGWHVHVHALLFVRRDITGREAVALGDSMFGRWSASLVAAGFDAPSLEHGVDVKLIGPHDANKVADYFSKNTFGGLAQAGRVGWEAAGGTGKSGRRGNRTPFRILQDLCSGEDYPLFERDVDLWWEWEQASKGKRQLTWSPWLRPYLELELELTDEEIAASELGGETVLRLRPDQFDAVVSVGAHELLDAVESDDDMTAAYAWLDEHLGYWRTSMEWGLSASGDWVEQVRVERVP